MNVGQTLTGNYTYSDADSDAEGTSTFRWLRDDVAIGGATSLTYVLVTADEGHAIKFEVTPMAAAGTTPGTAVQSAARTCNSKPVASNVTITVESGLVANTPETGSVLTGSYTYSDADSDAEGTSTFRWLRDDVAIGGATSITYTPVAADVGHALKFEVTPVAAAGVTPGTAVASAATNNVCTCYYVDTAAANDLGAGTSPATAWKTMAKVGSSSFVANDRVRFKRAGDWTGTTQLSFPSSGTNGNNIIIGAYGSGAKPILANTSSNPLRIFQKNYLTIEYLDLRTTAAAPCLILNGCTGVTVSYCDATGNATQNNGCYGIAGAVSNLTITHCTGHLSQLAGVHSYNADGTHMSNIVIEYCTMYDNGVGSPGLGYHGIYLSKGSINCIVRYNECYGNTGSGIKSNSEMGASSEKHLIYGNNCHDNNNYGMYMGGVADWCDIYNNLLVSNGSGGDGYGLYLQAGAVVNVYHNTAVNNEKAGLRIYGAAISGCVFKNNIWFQDQAILGNTDRPYYIDGVLATIAGANTFTNNILYYKGAIDSDVVNTETLAEWQAVAGSPDANSLNSDPKFVTEYTNLNIQTSSPAKNAGATGLGISVDYAGTARDANPDIGAYEYA